MAAASDTAVGVLPEVEVAGTGSAGVDRTRCRLRPAKSRASSFMTPFTKIVTIVATSAKTPTIKLARAQSRRLMSIGVELSYARSYKQSMSCAGPGGCRVIGRRAQYRVATTTPFARNPPFTGAVPKATSAPLPQTQGAASPARRHADGDQVHQFRLDVLVEGALISRSGVRLRYPCFERAEHELRQFELQGAPRSRSRPNGPSSTLNCRSLLFKRGQRARDVHLRRDRPAYPPGAWMDAGRPRRCRPAHRHLRRPGLHADREGVALELAGPPIAGGAAGPALLPQGSARGRACSPAGHPDRTGRSDRGYGLQEPSPGPLCLSRRAGRRAAARVEGGASRRRRPGRASAFRREAASRVANAAPLAETRQPLPMIGGRLPKRRGPCRVRGSTRDIAARFADVAAALAAIAAALAAFAAVLAANRQALP